MNTLFDVAEMPPEVAVSATYARPEVQGSESCQAAEEPAAAGDLEAPYVDGDAAGTDGTGPEDEEVNLPEVSGSSVQFRPYQEKCIRDVATTLEPPHPKRGEPIPKKVLAVSPTGTGKTVMMAGIVRVTTSNQCNLLWLVPPGPPTQPLINQAVKSLQRIGRRAIEEKGSKQGLPGFLEHWAYQQTKPPHQRTGATIVASVSTMQRARLQRWIEALAPYGPPKILVDEAHHTPAASVMNILNSFPSSMVIGFTATPERADKIPLGRFYEALAFEYKLTDAITDGWLVRPWEVPLKTDPPMDLRNIRMSVDGDFSDADLAEKLLDNMERICSELKAAIVGRRTLAFVPDIRAAHALCIGMRQLGVRAAWVASMGIDGKPMSEDARQEILDQFEAGEYDLLINPFLLAEGFDAPFIDCVAILRPTRSWSLFAQMVGRGLRLHPGKENCLIVNLACDGHEWERTTNLFKENTSSPQVMARAQEMVDRGEVRDVMQALEIAEEEHRQETARFLTLNERKPTAQRLVYDPLAALELIGFKPARQENNWYQVRPAEQKDKEWLDRYYNKKRQIVDVESLSFYAAKDLKRLAIDRMNRGLVNHNQIALLISRGMPAAEAANVRFDEMDMVLEALKMPGMAVDYR